MPFTEKLVFGAVVVVIAAGVSFGMVKVFGSSNTPSFGGVSGAKIENYLPYIMYNGGYNSALPIKTSNTFSAATSTMSQQVNLTNPTLCFNFYATSTATNDKLVLNTGSTTATATVGLLGVAYGSCAN